MRPVLAGTRMAVVVNLPKTPPPWVVATLSLVFFAIAGDQAPAQNSGCARCSPPAASARAALSAVRPRMAFVERTRRIEGWRLKTALGFAIQPGPKNGGDYTI